MKVLWCWRCRMELPMLDEEEYAKIAVLYHRAMQEVKHHREETGISLAEVRLPDFFQPVCEAYSALTGFPETNATAVMHHRISLHGAACPKCTRPFRTPAASFCAECGYRR